MTTSRFGRWKHGTACSLILDLSREGLITLAHASADIKRIRRFGGRRRGRFRGLRFGEGSAESYVRGNSSESSSKCAVFERPFTPVKALLSFPRTVHLGAQFRKRRIEFINLLVSRNDTQFLSSEWSCAAARRATSVDTRSALLVAWFRPCEEWAHRIASAPRSGRYMLRV
jgi:hypothetical protein